ncbi:hypothetical protein F4778DRAFT_780407 [Xylariomycetidae sp. FL2044]|nr:hypothetical protein F4778DRAFT_780407 [Xylariomycetidae sp. FL2044]
MACELCRRLIVCPVDDSIPYQWQHEVVLLSDPDMEFETREEYYRGGKKPDAPPLHFQRTSMIRKDYAHKLASAPVLGMNPFQYDLFRIDDSGAEVRARIPDGRDEDGDWGRQPYYIAIHRACLTIAEKMFELSRRGLVDCYIRDLTMLWKTLRMAADAGMAPNPLQISDLTSTVLSNFINMGYPPRVSTEKQAFQRRVTALPVELRHHIFSYLSAGGPLPLACTGLLPSWMWMDILLGMWCTPYLWDLDRSAVEAAERDAEGQNNWELLVRCFSRGPRTGKGITETPHGLVARYRNWELGKSLRVGSATTQMEKLLGLPLPRYWDESGDAVHPVVLKR